MKILLLGDYSAVQGNLKIGLEILGHDVTLVSSRDGFKKIPVDIDLDSSRPGVLGKIDRFLKPQLLSRTLDGYDIVQVINPFIFFRHKLPNWVNQIYYQRIFQYLKSHNNKVFMLAAGSDAYFWRNTESNMRYSPHRDEIKYDLNGNMHPLARPRAFDFNQKFLEWVDGVIPTIFEYEIAYAGEDKLLSAIPVPVDVDSINFMGNKKRKNINLFHGLNRPGVKGTHHVAAAFDKILQMRSGVETNMKGYLPLSDYLELMYKMDIVVDQVNAYSLGMNGLFAMAMGKVVLGGSEPESLACLGLTDSPVVNVLPDKKDIVEKLVNLLDDPNGLEERSFASRKFVERVHDCKKVAQNFLDVWENPEQHKNQHKILSTAGYLNAS